MVAATVVAKADLLVWRSAARSVAWSVGKWAEKRADLTAVQKVDRRVVGSAEKRAGPRASATVVPWEI